MPFNTVAQMSALHTLVASVTGVQTVSDGVPQALGSRVTAYITLAGQRLTDKAGGLTVADCGYLVTFGYRVAGAEGTAEAALAAVVDAFKVAFYAARKTDTVLRGMTLDLSLADQPRYQLWAASEYREYPCLVACRQEANT